MHYVFLMLEIPWFSELTASPTILKYFDVHSFKTHGIITSLHIDLGGNIVSVEVEVVDAKLDYNLLSSPT